MKRAYWIFRLLILLFGLQLSVCLSGQNKASFNIQFDISGSNDSLLYLVSYYGDKTILIDTSIADSHASFVFQGDSLLPEGMYIIAGEKKNRILEFLIGKDQDFSIKTDIEKPVENITVNGSKENKLFFHMIKYMGEKQEELQSLLNKKKNLKDADSIEAVDKSIAAINDGVGEYRKDLINRHKDCFFSAFLKGSMEPEIPDFNNNNSKEDIAGQKYRYYKKHYWDNIDFSNEAFIRTPYFHKKLLKYMEETIVQHPDSISIEIDHILERAEANDEMFKYLLWEMLIHYERSNVMGFDAVFVHLAENYLNKNDRAPWMNTAVKKNIIERAQTLSPLLLNKKAPQMVLMDTNNKAVSLHHINAKYTIIFFWDTDCGHCKKETPKLKDFYQNYKDSLNIEVYGVCIDTSMKRWKDYIKKQKLNWINVNGYLSYTRDFHDLYDIFSSPVMYLLDDDKKIIAKRILTDQIKSFILRKEGILNNENYEKSP